jgi:hypothetical protein
MKEQVMKKTFWCVKCVIYGTRNDWVRVFSEEHAKKPANSVESNHSADMYVDWFDTREEAEAFRKKELSSLSWYRG